MKHKKVLSVSPPWVNKHLMPLEQPKAQGRTGEHASM